MRQLTHLDDGGLCRHRIGIALALLLRQAHAGDAAIRAAHEFEVAVGQ